MKAPYLCLLFITIASDVSEGGLRRLLSFNSEDDLKAFLKDVYEANATEQCYLQNVAKWNFNTDVNNKDKEQALLEQTLESAAVDKEIWEQYFHDLNVDDYKDEIVKRQVRVLRLLGNAALDLDKLTELTNTQNEMTNVYSTGRICPYKKQDCDLAKEGLSLKPGIESILSDSTDYDELLYAWLKWREATGAKIKKQYQTYVQLSNEAAKANGFADKGEMWRDDYETNNFEEYLDKLWKQVEPLYDSLHQYVRNKLKERYGDKIDISDGKIPAHVLGNMWAQSWEYLSDLVKPYPEVPTVDVTKEMIKQNYTVLKMFETADDFYQSMGLFPNDICYNTSAGAVIEKPPDRDILCHASAWDFCDGQNFRIKMCTSVNYEYFVTVHHEMGHIQYYLQYKHLPHALRTGANKGFHEAIGDTIALSVATPKHLHTIGLLQDYTESNEADVNALMKMALLRLAFLPYGLLIDKWRWDVFSGKATPDNWNSRYWHYRETLQKIKAPVPRSDKTDFDPGAKFHVPADGQYINYFIARIVQFQLYRGLCKESGQYDPNDPNKPLHRCDFYKSKAAGDKFSAGLKLGYSKHWKDALEAMTGERDLDASAILEYFAPLKKFLDEQNLKVTDTI